MGANFYLSKTQPLAKASSFTFGEADFGFDPGSFMKKQSGLGYGSFAAARARILSHFDAHIGLAYFQLPLFPKNAVLEKAVEKMQVKIPPAVLAFSLKVDCDAHLTWRQCAKIVEELGDGYNAFMPIDYAEFETIPLIHNDVLRIDRVAFNAQYVFSAIKKAAEQKMYLIWR